MKTLTQLLFFCILIAIAGYANCQTGAKSKKAIYLQLGASGGYSPNLLQPVLIPQLGLDATFGIIGFRANGQFFRTSPEFDINGYLDPIKSVLTISNLQENNSNVFLGFAPYLSFGKKAFNIQPGVGLKYLMQRGATATAVYNQTPGTSILKFPDGDANRNLFVIEPNIRASFGKPGNFLRFYLEAGYSLPQGSNEYTYTSRSIPNVIDPRGNIDVKTLLNSKQVTATENSIPAFASIGAGIEIKILSIKKQNEPDKKDTKYVQPQIVSPADGTVINDADANKPVIFKWTPVIPKPREEVTYYLKVFEVKQGQTANEAIKRSVPLLEKGLKNQIQYILPLLSQLNANKGSSYAWYVQALNPKGKPYGGNNGNSEVAVFRSGSNDIDIRIDSLITECCLNGNHQIKIVVKNLEPNLDTKVEKIIIDAVNGNYNSPYPIDISNLVSPSLPFSFLPSTTSPSQGRMTFIASVDCISNMNNIEVRTKCSRIIGTNPNPVIDEDVEKDTIKCTCTIVCDSVLNAIPSDGTIKMDSTLSLQTPNFSFTPGGVKSIKAQLVYFEFKPETDDCVPCNRDSHEWGNFIEATFSDSEFPVNGIQSRGHEWHWTTVNTNGATVNGQFDFNISMAPLVKCCKLDVKFCIRYIFEFADCSVCEKVVCYSYSKTN
jgi:hypothetical protein